jgi:two-component system, cell cycle sensor histidine kinase and response regulator CckA
MTDESETKQQMKDELAQLRRRVGKLEESETRLKAEVERLKENEDKLRLILDHGNNLFYSHTPDHTLTYMSPQTNEFLDCEPEAALVNWTEFVTDNPINAQGFILTQRAIETGERQPPFHLELVGKGGRKIWVEVNESPVVVNGETVAMVGALTDITDRRRREEALRRQTHLLRAMLTASPDIIVYKDLDLVFQAVNPAFCAFLGREEDEILGRTNYDLFPHGEAQRYERDDLKVLETRKPSISEESITGVSGTRWVHKIKAPVMDDHGRAGGILVSVRDITDRKHAEEMLRTEHAFRSAVIEHAAEGICVGHEIEEYPYIRFTVWNALMTGITGYSMDEINRLGWCQGLYPDPETQAKVTDRIAKMRNGEDLVMEECRIIRADGVSRTVNISTSIVLRKGTTVHYLALIQDVTDRKLAEKALLQSEEQFRTLAEVAPYGLSIMKPDESFEYFNPKFSEIFGYTLEHLPNKEAWFRQAYPDDEYRDLIASLWKRDTVGDNRRHKRFNERVFTVRCLDGQDKMVHFRNVTLEDGRQFMTYEDITTQVRAERALWESEKRFRQLYQESTQREQQYESLLNSTPDAVAIYDIDGRASYINPAFTTIFGFTMEDIQGMKIPFVPEGEKGAMRAGLDQVLSGKPISAFETKRFTKEGRLLDITLSSSCYPDHEGNPAGIVVILRDVTAAKQMEKQLLHAQKMEAVGTLAGGVAHDFNNLLQAVHGYTELLLLDMRDKDRGFRELREIKRAAQRGSDLTRQLLTFSRKVESQLRPIDINRRVAQITRLFEHTIPRMIAIELRLQEDVRTINADPNQIEQSLINLVVNAKDAMPEGGKLVIATRNVTLDDDYCRLYPEACPGDHVLLSVCDTGHGMGKETVKHIFDPFYTTKEVGKGTGLGLSTVYGIVKNHGGHITCSSEPGEGTVFSIFLPALASSEEEIKIHIQASPRGGTETILFVDDEELIRDMASQMLTGVGYKVLVAENGESALDMFHRKSQTIDLVVLDLIMPGMGGNRCLEGLIEMDPSVRVITSTGYSADELSLRSIHGACKAFLRKPYDFNTLLEAVRNVLDQTD